MKAAIGLEVAFAEVGGWDTHANQGGAQGQLALRLDDFARSVAALTTAFRDVFAEIVARHLGVADAQPIFPGYDIEPSRFVRLFR